MPDPEKFHGDRTKLPDFLTQMCLKLLANRDRFLNQDAMTIYIISRLDGAALRQIATFIDGINIDFASLDELLNTWKHPLATLTPLKWQDVSSMSSNK